MRVEVAAVRQMIGVADHSATFRWLELLLKGEIAEVMADIQAQYNAGADPLMLVQDVLAIIHLVTRVKISPQVALADVTLSEYDRSAAKKLADNLTMPILTRLWQMLLKGVSEVKIAPSPLSALEMLLVRVAFGSQLPTPAEIIKNLETEKKTPDLGGKGAEKKQISDRQTLNTEYKNFGQVVELFQQNREFLLYTNLKNDVHLVAFEAGKIELRLAPELSRDFIAKITDLLNKWTGISWKILISDAKGESTIAMQEAAQKAQNINELSTHPLITKTLTQFTGAKLVEVRS
jgi:DNA polymerase-3 subunit gamma/tau